MKIPALLLRIASIAVAACIVVGYLTIAAWNNWFPAPIVKAVDDSFRDVADTLWRPWYAHIQADGKAIDNRAPGRVEPGLVLLSGVGANRRNFIRIIDRDGKVVQSWVPDWFTLWPDAEGFVEERIPRAEPGVGVHGIVVTAEGDVVFNFEKLSTMRLDACGNIVWKLKNAGHHSIFQDLDGNFWVPSVRTTPGLHPDYRNIAGRHEEDLLQKISADGRILMEKSAFDILRQNGLEGLLYLSTNENEDTLVNGDILHVNDIEVYEGAEDGKLVRRGDILVSMRNINALMLLDPATFRIKALSIGRMLRQHDPDFIGGDQIVVFDNNNLAPTRLPDDPGSRIVQIDLATGDRTTRFEGSAETQFFSTVLGSQQLLANGNLLVVASMQARAFEVAPDGELLWQAKNLIADGYGGLLADAQVLPVAMDAGFFARARARCGG